MTESKFKLKPVKRKQPTQELSHINYAIPAKAHTPMYLMHKWWARKPHNVVSEYIKAYSKEGEIVLDPFAGSGVTAIEAIKENRKAVAIDLDPMATFISRMTAIPSDINEIKKTYIDIVNSIRKDILKNYVTKCPKCGKNAIIICSIWMKDESIPREIRFYCRSCKAYVHKKPDTFDIQKLEEINRVSIPYWYPNPSLYYPNGKPFVKKEKSEHISDLFTKRNLVCLSTLLHKINSIEDPLMRDLFRFRFTSMVHLASTLTPVRPTRPHSSFWGAAHSYWAPPVFMESNVWLLFKSAIKGRQGLIKGKVDANESIKYYREAEKFDDLFREANIFIKNYDCLELDRIIPPNSIDYVFTDPPYGGSIQYFELSTLWCSWLGLILDFDKEVTINRNQDKDFDYYHKMLRASFEQIYRVLKPGKYLTVTFHNTNIQIYNSILKAVVLSGFDLEKVVYQPPARPSAKMLLQPYGSANGDYYIRFRKSERKGSDLIAYSEIDKERYEKIIVDAVKKIIGEYNEPISYMTIVNSYPIIYDELKKNGYLFSAPETIDEILKRNLDKDFVLKNVLNEKGKIIGQKWWLKGVLFLDRVPLSERIEAVTLNVLNRGIEVSFDDVLQQVYTNFTNALTPETQSIKNALEEYAEQRNGKWRLLPTIKQRESEHNPLVEILANIGTKAGLTVYADLPGWRREIKLPYPKEKLDRIKKIDVLWLDKQGITHEFEVENSTGISEAVVRGSNIPEKNVKRYIVIPEERQEFFYRKISEPMLKERISEYDWKFIYYDAVKEFYEKNEKNKEIDVSDFEEIAGTPKLENRKQQPLKGFISP